MEPIWPDAPRYGPDESFPAYAFLPGSGQPHPTRDPEGHSYGKEIDPAHAFERGIDLYHAGYLWEAHEAWEGLWKAADPEDPDRDFLRGLIQLAAALLKERMQAPRGAAELHRRARERLERVAAADPHHRGLDLRAILAAQAAGTPPRLRRR